MAGGFVVEKGLVGTHLQADFVCSINEVDLEAAIWYQEAAEEIVFLKTPDY